jgi:hypothetical protein
MDDLIVWLIIALFYAPLHYLLPLLIVFVRNSENPGLRKQRLLATAIDCSLSMGIAFALVIYLAGDAMFKAMLVLLVSMFVPYLRLVLRKSAEVAADNP